MTTLTNLAVERVSRRSFQAADVQRIAQITYRQLDHWTRSELVHASGHPSTGHGDARWYRDTDVVRICVIAALVRAGVDLRSIRNRIDDVLDNGGTFYDDDIVSITVDITRLRDRVSGYRRAAS